MLLDVEYGIDKVANDHGELGYIGDRSRLLAFECSSYSHLFSRLIGFFEYKFEFLNSSSVTGEELYDVTMADKISVSISKEYKAGTDKVRS